MATTVRFDDDPTRVLVGAREFLASDPIRHNLILTLLHIRAAFPNPGRYWTAEVDGEVVAVTLQSPLDHIATITPTSSDAVAALVDAIVEQGVELPGVSGEAATAARFAGHWTERTKSAARPAQGQRIYELEEIVDLGPTTGRLRRAATAERDLLVDWFQAFQAEIGDGVGDASGIVDRRLAAGQLWTWDDATPVAVAGLSDAVHGVVRVGPVYTPPNRRNRGYASAVVTALSRIIRSEGQRGMLYTDLNNPTSNSIYRAIGYRAVAEVIEYHFVGPPLGGRNARGHL